MYQVITLLYTAKLNILACQGMFLKEKQKHHVQDQAFGQVIHQHVDTLNVEKSKKLKVGLYSMLTEQHISEALFDTPVINHTFWKEQEALARDYV